MRLMQVKGYTNTSLLSFPAFAGASPLQRCSALHVVAAGALSRTFDRRCSGRRCRRPSEPSACAQAKKA